MIFKILNLILKNVYIMKPIKENRNFNNYKKN
jgi:hypothetical protein